MNPTAPIDLGFSSLQRHYLAGSLSPSVCIAHVLARIEAAARAEVWISRVDADSLFRRATQLEYELARLGDKVLERFPLFGLPFAVKDNIDVAGMPTTAACPAFAYVPQVSAHVVERLLDAGAILIGKTNLDQFATGLVGVRSPYGAVRNALNPEYVSGGSSSGSAVAVALGLVSFSLGTDTAGSGRVPAGFNHIVGLKPSRGLLSNGGVFPACRTLDCVSIFAATVPDAWRAVGVAAGYDAADPWSRRLTMSGVKRRGYRIAIPDRREFFGDTQAEEAFAASLASVRTMPNVEIDSVPFEVFAEAARLLYEGPWVAERRAAVGDFFDTHRDDVDPSVKTILAKADRFNAVDAFNGQYRLAALKREADTLLAPFDFMLVPTTPTMPTLADLAAEPLLRNSELGYYTNFVNFFDMAALALPGAWRADGLPSGITLIGPSGADQRLAAFGEAAEALFTGAANVDAVASAPLPFNETSVKVAVVGAHLSGQPLNWQLLERGARKVASTTTSAHYRLYALANTTPPKPGLVRVAEQGAAIAIEVWELPVRLFGEFVAQIPAPLGIGSLELADGSWVSGFICEPWALASATDITAHGGWRAYLSQLTQ
ncbi:MAG: allophanate hydrolase [Massilia sp.]